MLVADIGNSRIKWAKVTAGRLGQQRATDYQDETLELLLSAEWSNLKSPQSLAYCSVGASATGAVIERWAGEHWGIGALRVVTEARGHGVRCAYARPETLGADRWAALVAFHHKRRGAAIIVDCGTAITLDALSQSGEHLGGVIVPGVSLMRRSLSAGTDQIPAQPSDCREVMARSTADGVAAGTLFAAAAAVDRLAGEMQRRMPVGSAKILTGGAAETLQPLLTTRFEHEPDLVLYGLAVIAGGIQ